MAIDEYKHLIEQKSNIKILEEPDSLYEPIRYLMNIGGSACDPARPLGYSLFKKSVKQAIPMLWRRGFSQLHPHA